MSFDAVKNFAYGQVLGAPNPAATGTSMTLAAGQGAGMPATPFNLVVWPSGQIPLSTNAEIVRVTNIAGDVLTMTRQQEGSSARAVQVGDQCAAAITAKTLTDLQNAAATAPLSGAGSPETVVTAPVGTLYTDSTNDNLYYKKVGTGATGWWKLLTFILALTLLGGTARAQSASGAPSYVRNASTTNALPNAFTLTNANVTINPDGSWIATNLSGSFQFTNGVLNVMGTNYGELDLLDPTGTIQAGYNTNAGGFFGAGNGLTNLFSTNGVFTLTTLTVMSNAVTVNNGFQTIVGTGPMSFTNVVGAIAGQRRWTIIDVSNQTANPFTNYSTIPNARYIGTTTTNALTIPTGKVAEWLIETIDVLKTNVFNCIQQ